MVTFTQPWSKPHSSSSLYTNPALHLTPNTQKMMIRVRNNNPTVNVSPCTLSDDLMPNIFSVSPSGNSNFNNTDDFSLTALRRYLPSNTDDIDFNLNDGVLVDEDVDFLSVDAYSCDHFRMYEFKVKKCARGRSHDWTECPYAHSGEKARRRDPRKYHYSGTACPDFRKGYCKRGDTCEFSHGVFECWLHPARYRTQPCKDGLNCRRRVCFFAHSPDQQRVLSTRTESYDGSPHRLALEGCFGKGFSFVHSPESESPPTESPPRTPMSTNSRSRSFGSNSVNEMVASLRQLQLNKVNSMPSCGIGSPRGLAIRPGFCSLPSTPTRVVTRMGIGQIDLWDKWGLEEEPVMERVESGRDVRAKMFEKLSKENPLDRVDPNPADVSNSDIGWVCELLK